MRLLERIIYTLILCGGIAGCTQKESLPGPLRDANYEPLVQAIARHEDRVNPEQLAEWIVRDRQDFVLVDVRTQEDFHHGHIDNARHVPITRLLDTKSLESLPRDRKLIVYSNGSENGAKAEVLLRLAGRPALVLQGGYNAWQQRVLNPDLTSTDEERLVLEKRRAIACYFAPQRSATVSPPPKPFKPLVSPIPALPTTGKPPGALITEEGC